MFNNMNTLKSSRQMDSGHGSNRKDVRIRRGSPILKQNQSRSSS